MDLTIIAVLVGLLASSFESRVVSCIWYSVKNALVILSRFLIVGPSFKILSEFWLLRKGLLVKKGNEDVV